MSQNFQYFRDFLNGKEFELELNIFKKTIPLESCSLKSQSWISAFALAEWDGTEIFGVLKWFLVASHFKINNNVTSS